MRRRNAAAAAIALLLVLGAAVHLGRARRRRRIDWNLPRGDIDEGPLVVRHLGDRGTPILLLHGLAASNISWGAAFDELASQCRLIVPDLLGFGGSPKPGRGYGPAEHADAVAECLRATTRPDDAAAIVGAHSTGCLVAFHLAARHPDLVHSIVAFAPLLYATEDDARSHIARLGLMERLFALDTPMAHTVCRWVCDHRDTAARLAVLLRPDLPAPIARDAVRHTWASYSQTVRDLLLAGSGVGVLEEIAVPIHLVVGLRDVIPDHSLLEQAAARLANVSLQRWPDADHQLVLTHPARAVGELRRALNRQLSS